MGRLVFPPLLRKQKLPPRPEPWTRDDTVVYTTTITVLCTASTLGVLCSGGPGPTAPGWC